jgi:hypothetical protein
MRSSINPLVSICDFVYGAKGCLNRYVDSYTKTPVVKNDLLRHTFAGSHFFRR